MVEIITAQNEWLVLSLIIILFITFFIIVINGIYGLNYSRKFYNYLKKNKSSRLKEIYGGSGLEVFLKTACLFKYIFNDIDCGDKIILEYKKEIRRSIKIFIFLAVIMAFIMIFLTVGIAFRLL